MQLRERFRVFGVLLTQQHLSAVEFNRIYQLRMPKHAAATPVEGTPTHADVVPSRADFTRGLAWVRTNWVLR